MITITLTPKTTAQLDAALELLKRIRDDELAQDRKFEAIFSGAATETMAGAAAYPAQPHVEVVEAAPAPTEPPAEAPAPVAPTVTLVELRAKLAQLSRDGRADSIKALLAEYGAAKLTDLALEHYAAVMARAQEV